MDREKLAARIDARVEAMIASGAADEAREAAEAGASRTARAALGFEQLLEGHDASPSGDEVEAIKAAHRRYARRQLTWMRTLEGVELIDRTGLSDVEVAERVVAGLG
jgi:tRNA dimethylallyltransferase